MKKLILQVTMLMMLIMLMACSSEEPVDLQAVEVELTTKPETVAAGSAVELQAAITGMKVSNKASVSFDIRIGDEPKLVSTAYQDGVFEGSFTFPKQGRYSVYIHLYTGDTHLTKKKEVEVR